MNLRARAIDADLKGKDIALRFNVSTQTVSKWLNRKAPVPDRHKVAFAELLRVKVEDLLPAPSIASGLFNDP